MCIFLKIYSHVRHTRTDMLNLNWIHAWEQFYLIFFFLFFSLQILIISITLCLLRNSIFFLLLYPFYFRIDCIVKFMPKCLLTHICLHFVYFIITLKPDACLSLITQFVPKTKRKKAKKNIPTKSEIKYVRNTFQQIFFYMPFEKHPLQLEFAKSFKTKKQMNKKMWKKMSSAYSTFLQ